MKKHVCIVICAALYSAVAVAGIDQPWNELRYEEHRGEFHYLLEGIFIVSIVAFFVRLIEKGDFGPFVAMVARGMWMLFLMYFWLALVLFSIILVSKFIQGFGISKNISGLFALPVGVYLVWRLFCFVSDRKELKTQERR